MAKATENSGRMQKLVKCKIITPYNDGMGNAIVIELRVLPEITDSKGATYQNETIPGRASPVPTFSHGDPRSISTELTFLVMTCADIEENLRNLRTIESLVYPGDAGAGSPYSPPPVCKFICGKLLGDNGVCVILKSYSVRFQSDVAWDTATYCPYKFTVSCQWEVVYNCANLPTNSMIRSLTKDWPCPPNKIDVG
jgi:hypothetical protein